MELQQIIIRPADSVMIIRYSDALMRMMELKVDAANIPAVAQIVADARGRIPAPSDRPDRPQIEREIQGLERRVQQLKQSIGQT